MESSEAAAQGREPGDSGGCWVDDVTMKSSGSKVREVVHYHFQWKPYTCELRDMPNEHRAAMQGESLEILGAYSDD